jgi:hypothetical protein
METSWTWDRRFAFGTSRRGIRIHWIANALLELEERSSGIEKYECIRLDPY